MDRERELEQRLERYQVTAVPAAPRLSLIWCAPAAGDDVDAEPGDETGTVALLSSYRITRVPSRAAG